jgi:hypothetical protein
VIDRPKAHDDIEWSDEWPKGAVMMTQKFDLLEDEPLELAVALRKHAEQRAGVNDDDDDDDHKVWSKFAEAMATLVSDLEALNLPKSHRDDASSA